jgi:4-aminobutyrate aminotransferase-like enzyme
LSSRPDLGSAAGVDFFRYGALPVPQVTVEEAERLAASSFGQKVRAQPTSDRMCVLKIKPPLCLDIDGADFFADALDRALTQGW